MCPIFSHVAADSEFERCFAIPRRPIPEPTSAEALHLAKELTTMLKRVAVPYPFRSPEDCLYATQALALKEIWENRGAVLPIRVGSGKSLLCYLAIAVMKPKWPMLLVPAAMVIDTEMEWRRFEKDWRGPKFDDVVVLSYERVSNPSSAEKALPDGTIIYPDIMERHRPDLLVFDECDRAGDVSATGTIRIGRYIEQHSPIVVAMSGTLIRRSLKDASHIFQWALGDDNCPLPKVEQFKALQAWSDALDAKGGKGGKRTEPGALLTKLTPVERTAYDSADSADDARGVVCAMVGTHILETRGVLGSQDGPLTLPGRIDPVYVEDEDDVIEEQYRLLLDGDEDNDRPKWTLPDGYLLSDARALAAPLVTLGLGMFLLQEPRPPEEYRLCRSAYNSAVREVVEKRPDLRLDSEFVVRKAIREGRLPDMASLLEEWEGAQRDYRETTGLAQPPSVPLWVSDELVRSTSKWLDQGPGIIWVSYVAAGAKLSKELKLPWFGAGKVDATGRHVTKLRKGEPAILSMASCGRGLNGLQFLHHRQLWLGACSEQPLARLHRIGQMAPMVYNDVYIGSAAALARYQRQKMTAVNFAGAISRQTQKLQYLQDFMPERLSLEGKRWQPVQAKDVADAGEDC